MAPQANVVCYLLFPNIYRFLVWKIMTVRQEIMHFLFKTVFSSHGAQQESQLNIQLAFADRGTGSYCRFPYREA